MSKRREFFKKSLLTGALVGFAGLNLEAKLLDENELEKEFNDFFKPFLNELEKESKILSQNDRALVILASLIANQSEHLNEFLEANLGKNLSLIDAREVLFQSVAYVGFAKVKGAFLTFKEFFEDKRLEKGSTTNAKNRQEKGYALQIKTFGERIKKAYENASPDTRHINRLLSANCFGDYYTRKGLDMRQREIITFAFLASLGDCENQLKGHTQGNLKVGNDRGILIATLTALIAFNGYPRTLNALNVVNEVTKEEK